MGAITKTENLAALFLAFNRVNGDQGVVQATEFAERLERLGPTFVKLGQLLSTRADLLPPAYLEALARLQDDVTPFPFADVERIVTEELGVRLSKAFASFDEEPLAAASLAQVHRAELRDGRVVAVKVQRPGIREQVKDDLAMLEKVAKMLDAHTRLGERFQLEQLVAEFGKSLTNELDYRQEAGHLARLRESLAEFDRLVIPAPVPDYTTSRVLTMDYIGGTKVTDVSPLVVQELDTELLASQLFEAYLKQVFVDGFFHADPHPGNVFLTDDGRVALIDLGMVSRLAPRMQEQLLQLILAVSEGRSDEAADVALRVAERREGFDERELRRRLADVVSRHQTATLEDMEIGRTFMLVANAAGDTGVRMPPELTMLGKTLLNLDGVGRALAPQFDPNAAIRRQSAKLMNARLIKSLSPGNILSTVIETKDLVTRLPARINRLLDAAADNKLGVKIDTGIDPAQLIVGMQKVANRIALGLVLAALIVGAAILMQVPTSFRVFGYPGIAMVLFLTAVGTGLGMLVHSLLHDIRARRPRRE